jgi:hypothetical protein
VLCTDRMAAMAEPPEYTGKPESEQREGRRLGNGCIAGSGSRSRPEGQCTGDGIEP